MNCLKCGSEHAGPKYVVPGPFSLAGMQFKVSAKEVGPYCTECWEHRCRCGHVMGPHMCHACHAAPGTDQLVPGPEPYFTVACEPCWFRFLEVNGLLTEQEP